MDNWFDGAKVESLKDKLLRYPITFLPTCLIELEAGTLRVCKHDKNTYQVTFTYLGRTAEASNLYYTEAVDTCILIGKVINIVLNI